MLLILLYFLLFISLFSIVLRKKKEQEMFYDCGIAKRKIYLLDKELEGIRNEVYRKTEYETEFIQRNLSTEQLFLLDEGKIRETLWPEMWKSFEEDGWNCFSYWL